MAMSRALSLALRNALFSREEGALESLRRSLLEEGANVNARCVDERIDFRGAVDDCQRFALIELLLECGADVNATDEDGKTPLHLALEKITCKTVRFRQATLLHIACYGGGLQQNEARLEMVRLLLEKGANVNAVSKDGWTPLHFACIRCHHQDVVKLLLQNQANVNAAQSKGWTPLHASCFQGHLDVVKLLLENKANVNAATRDGVTPLHWACRKGHLDVVKLLLDNQADIASLTGSTPLDLAVAWRHVDIYVLLVEKAFFSKNKKAHAIVRSPTERRKMKPEIQELLHCLEMSEKSAAFMVAGHEKLWPYILHRLGKTIRATPMYSVLIVALSSRMIATQGAAAGTKRKLQE